MSNSVKKVIKKIMSMSQITENFYEMASELKMDLYKNKSDEEYIRKVFKAAMGREPELLNPKTFNDKLQWLKLNDHNPMYTTLVDKYEVKQYVKEKIGVEYVIPTLGGPWTDAKNICIDTLPNQFVLKCNHDCGSIIICKDKSKFNLNLAKKKMNRCLKNNYYLMSREWPYKNVKPLIFAEKYMVDGSNNELEDYKFFCFNGKPKYMFIATDRMSKDETKFDFFDMSFKHLDITNGHPNADIMPSKPHCFEEMKTLAEKLSYGIPHVRVDFYEVNNHVYFGEMTFFHWGG